MDMADLLLVFRLIPPIIAQNGTEIQTFRKAAGEKEYENGAAAQYSRSAGWVLNYLKAP
jgi:hypothetical protein